MLALHRGEQDDGLSSEFTANCGGSNGARVRRRIARTYDVARLMQDHRRFAAPKLFKIGSEICSGNQPTVLPLGGVCAAGRGSRSPLEMRRRV